MAGLVDLSPCPCLPVFAEHVLGVGWLERSIDFPTGPTPRDVFTRLTEFVRNPWQPFVSAGYHPCDLCQFDAEKSGTVNLYIPFQGKIYVCPDLIIHYINAHHYLPPIEFCDAVIACPAMDSMEYKRLLIACNGRVLWQDFVQKPSNATDLPS